MAVVPAYTLAMIVDRVSAIDNGVAKKRRAGVSGVVMPCSHWSQRCDRFDHRDRLFALGRPGAPMPLHFCHPVAPHKKLRMPEWYVSSLMMERALDAVVRRVKHFDRKHDIPYLAGYSRDGKIIYIDRHMPSSFKFRGRTVE